MHDGLITMPFKRLDEITALTIPCVFWITNGKILVRKELQNSEWTLIIDWLFIFQPASRGDKFPPSFPRLV